MTSEPWWDPMTGNTLGAYLGAGMGCLGGLHGALIGMLAPKGKAKGFVLSVHIGLLAVGAVLLLTGGVALALGQPRHVWYALMLPGGILAMILGSLLPVVFARYREAEMRRLTAAELRRA